MVSTPCGRKTKHSWVVLLRLLPLLLLLVVHLPNLMESTRPCQLKPMDLSPTFNPSTLWLQSMLHKINGRSSRESRPRPLDSLLFKPLLVLLNSTTNTVVSMLVTGIHTRTLLLYLTQLFRNTMEFLLVQSTHLIWKCPRSRVTLMKMFQFTLAESVLVAQLMDLAFPPVLQRINVLELRN